MPPALEGIVSLRLRRAPVVALPRDFPFPALRTGLEGAAGGLGAGTLHESQ